MKGNAYSKLCNKKSEFIVTFVFQEFKFPQALCFKCSVQDRTGKSNSFNVVMSF